LHLSAQNYLQVEISTIANLNVALFAQDDEESSISSLKAIILPAATSEPVDRDTYIERLGSSWKTVGSGFPKALLKPVSTNISLPLIIRIL